MAIALMFRDNSVLYLDAVVNFNKGKTATIASNPLDNRTVIADHVSKDNPTFSVKGVVSSADFQESYTRSLDLLSEYGTQIPREFNSAVPDVSIGDESMMTRLFSESIVSSFLNQDTPEVVMSDFRGYSHEIARDKLNSAFEGCEIITILDYNYDPYIGRSVSVRSYKNCLIKNFNDIEDPNTGDSLNFDITFEQVRFSYAEQVDISTSGKKGKRVNKGTVTKDTQGSNKAVSNDKKMNSWESEHKQRAENALSSLF